MSRILIVDDDRDFNSLLTDIFQQSGHEVVSTTDPVEGFDLYSNQPFSLVVTDQKMPGMTGDALIRKMRAVRSNIPIIMVSGFLDNETIRSLIREGVSGVFLKPLNVFSLLKRSNQLIEEASKEHKREDSNLEGAPESESYDSGLPFSFETFPCRSPRSLEFAQRLFELRNFKSNLLVVGGKGTDLASIARDLTGFDTDEKDVYCQINSGELDANSLSQAINDARQQHSTRLTIIVPHPETLDTSQRNHVYAAARHERPFADVDFPIRYVFFLSDEIDALYDHGALSDDLYMFLGTLEIRVPELREVRDDLTLLMLRYLREEAYQRRLPPVTEFDSRARIYIREREWRGNALEMKSFCRELSTLGKTMLTREDLETIERQLNLSASSFGDLNLKRELEYLRDDYCLAMVKLCEGRKGVASRLLQVDDAFLENLLENHD